jgi:SH3-like domain-containing protein
MSMKSARLLPLAISLLSLLASGMAHAIEFKSVGAVPAILYDAPSEKGRKVFVAPRGMPVEVVLTYGEWTKVRDAGGDLAWVESKSLAPKRSVITSVAGAKVRAAADDASPVVLTADKGVLFELSEPASSGWIKVRHRDGQSGFIKSAEIWGE